MRDPRSPDHEPPPADQTLQQWLASSEKDWAVSQPTLWLPAVPAEPAPPDPRLSIPEQRGSRRRRAVPRAGHRSTRSSAGDIVDEGASQAAESGTLPPRSADPVPDNDAVAPNESGVLGRYPRRAVVGLLLMTALLIAVLALGVGLSSALLPR